MNSCIVYLLKQDIWERTVPRLTLQNHAYVVTCINAKHYIKAIATGRSDSSKHAWKYQTKTSVIFFTIAWRSINTRCVMPWIGPSIIFGNVSSCRWRFPYYQHCKGMNNQECCNQFPSLIYTLFHIRFNSSFSLFNYLPYLCSFWDSLKWFLLYVSVSTIDTHTCHIPHIEIDERGIPFKFSNTQYGDLH